MACGIAPEFVAILSVTAGITLPLVAGVTYMHLSINKCINKNAFCEGFLRIICCEQRDIDAPDVQADATVKTIASQPPPYTYSEKVDNVTESTC